METTNNKPNYADNAATLKSYVLQTLVGIEDYIRLNNLTVRSENSSIAELAREFNGNDYITTKSQNVRKKMARFAEIFNKKNSIKNANRYLHFLSKEMGGTHKIKVDLPAIELDIQTARAEMKAKKAEFEKALATYKLRKGDYYKNKPATAKAA